MELFTTPNSKNIIATLRIVTIDKSELTFLLTLYFHEEIHTTKRYIQTEEIHEPKRTGSCS